MRPCVAPGGLQHRLPPRDALLVSGAVRRRSPTGRRAQAREVGLPVRIDAAGHAAIGVPKTLQWEWCGLSKHAVFNEYATQVGFVIHDDVQRAR